MAKLFITRHGQTVWNKEGRLQGKLDSPLTSLGKKQARWLGERLNDEHIDIIYSSSSPRALSTAKLIRGERNIDIITNDNLKEMGFGSWQGQLKSDIDKKWPNEQHLFRNSPHKYKPVDDGETYEGLINRINKEIKSIIDSNKGKNILIVTHGVALKAYMMYIEKKTLDRFWDGMEINSTCLSIVDYTDEPKILLAGDISHYKDEGGS